MKRIDSHQHFWNYDAVRDAWITDDMSVIQRNFLPADLEGLLLANEVEGCVAVQADQSEQETDFLLELARQSPFIKGVVGWVDLKNVHIEERLAHYSLFPKLKGFRHVLQGEADPQFMLSPSFIRGVAALYKFDFSYDILVKPKQLPAVIKFLPHFDNEQRFVIDHLAKPYIAARKTEPWATEMSALARHPNLYCKLSGMVTEASWKHWKTDDFSFYINHLLETFGPNRLMFGSDWPVCLVAGQYEQIVDLLDKHLSSLTSAEQEAIWRKNAEEFYNL
ncbi:amidohydrolase family protein [Olivibacter sp. CPCC 100613]|uniref:amidohydrolase family protein n=1 Tax=Olivibacter sp. CPCC 100613 TaxID=3079931 RepID=UPI002FF490C2